MKIRNSSDWRDALPFDTALRASEAVPGDPTRCATCGPASELRDREDLWVVKHRHPNNPAGFARLYCTAHKPTIAPRPVPDFSPAKAVRARRERAARAVAAPTIPERPVVLCPDCFVEVPATGICGMCGQRVG